MSLENASPASPPIVNPRVPALFFAATILLSAFLLFQVQPLIAKLILPWFGGSAAVWTSCMLFFQVALLGGYAYAHWLSRLSSRRQAAVHLSLLALSFLSLPILPSAWWKPHGAEDPLLRILGLLAVTVGLPYFLLSSTSPLLQSWYSRSNGGAMPYRFFALSNAGSMLGLLTYPVLVEPYLWSGEQAWMWSATYIVFAVVCAAVALRSRGRDLVKASVSAGGERPAWSERLLWIALASCSSALLLAVTNHLTQNVAAIPFLWVVPLSLYLLSFILCFDSDRWYSRRIFTGLGAVALLGLVYAMHRPGDFTDLRGAVAFFCATSFVIFMVCHGELARRRPAPAFLTGFYLMASVGGAVGGLLIGVAAPYLFNAVYDLPVVLSLTSLLFLYLLWQARAQVSQPSLLPAEPFLEKTYDKVVVGALSLGLPGFMAWRILAGRKGSAAFLQAPYDGPTLLSIGGALILYVMWRRRDALDAAVMGFWLAALSTVGMAGMMAHDVWKDVHSSVFLGRNFYGALDVYDADTDGSMGPVRVLRHGTIDHGEQFRWPQYQRFPTTYYATASGIGLAIQNLQMQGAMNVGVIGLGAGTLTTYERPIDRYTVYDINPLVLRIAQNDFRFLRECLGPHQVVLGDARLSLEREPSRQFDVLAVDAFSGDAIPVHLLTREAFALYWRHLKPDGVLAVHVSNHYLNLAPVVALGGAEDHKQAMVVSNSDDDDKEIDAADWVLVTSRPGFFEQPEIRKAANRIDPIPGLRPWTDDFSNLYKILR